MNKKYNLLPIFLPIISLVFLVSYVTARSVKHPEMRMLKPITKETVKDIRCPEDLGCEDIKQIIPNLGEGLGYYFEKYRTRLPEKQGHEVEFYGLTLVRMNYDDLADFLLIMMQWQDEGDISKKIYQNLPNLSKYLKEFSTARREMTIENMGDYQKVVVRIVVDRHKLAKRYPQLRFTLENSLEFFQATVTDQVGDKMLQFTIKGTEQIEIVFLKDRYGCLITADENWEPIRYPDNPQKIKKYHWRWLPPDFRCLVNISQVLDARLAFVPLFHLDMPNLTVRFDVEKKEGALEIYAKTIDVQVKSAKLGGLESRLLHRAAYSQKDHLKAHASIWAKSLGEDHYTIFRADTCSLIPDHWLVNLVMRAFESFGEGMLRDFAKPALDFFVASKKDIDYIGSLSQEERMKRGLILTDYGDETGLPPKEMGL